MGRAYRTPTRHVTRLAESDAAVVELARESHCLPPGVELGQVLRIVAKDFGVSPADLRGHT